MANQFKEIFRSTEDKEETVCQVQGTLPAWLNGDLIQCGPGRFDFDKFTVKHWLDGMCVLQKFGFKEGTVTYTKKTLQSDSFKGVLRAKKTLYTEFGTKCHPDPDKNFFSRMVSSVVPGDLTDNCAVNVFGHSGNLYCATETCFIRRIAQESLETGQKVDLNQSPGVNMAACHILTDPEDGTTYNFGSVFMAAVPKYHFFKVPCNKEAGEEEPFKNSKILCSIPSRWNAGISYYHSFCMTKNYLIFVEMPLKLNTIKMAQTAVKGWSLKDCMEWKPEEKNLFHVVDKTSGELVKQTYVSSEPFFYFHQANAYEEDNQIIMDLVTYPDASQLDELFIKDLRSNKVPKDPRADLQRFVLPLVKPEQNTTEGRRNLVTLLETRAEARLEGGKIVLTPENIGVGGWELPDINNSYRFKPYRYIYGTGMLHKGPYQNSLCKIDLKTQDRKTWKEDEFCYAVEPAFVQSPDPTDVDDGLILSVVVNVQKNCPDFLVALDAKELKEVARVELPSKAVYTLHGLYVPAERK